MRQTHLMKTSIIYKAPSDFLVTRHTPQFRASHFLLLSLYSKPFKISKIVWWGGHTFSKTSQPVPISKCYRVCWRWIPCKSKCHGCVTWYSTVPGTFTTCPSMYWRGFYFCDLLRRKFSWLFSMMGNFQWLSEWLTSEGSVPVSQWGIIRKCHPCPYWQAVCLNHTGRGSWVMSILNFHDEKGSFFRHWCYSFMVLHHCSVYRLLLKCGDWRIAFQKSPKQMTVVLKKEVSQSFLLGRCCILCCFDQLLI